VDAGDRNQSEFFLDLVFGEDDNIDPAPIFDKNWAAFIPTYAALAAPRIAPETNNPIEQFFDDGN
jgi:hypothetical protein